MNASAEILLLMLCVFGFVSLFTWWGLCWVVDTEQARLRERLTGERASDTRVATPFSTLVASISQAAAKPFMPSDGQRQSAMRRQLAYAGIYSSSGVRAIAAARCLCLIGGVGAGYLTGWMLEQTVLGLSLGGLLGYVLPTLWLKRQIAVNRLALEHGLPDALDLMVVCVEAGLTTDAAFQRVGQELALAHPRLSRELDITHMETRMGVARADALQNLGRRTGSAGLQTLASMLVQAERFGTSIAQSLRVHAETMRVTRQHAAEETAAKATVKLSFPVVLFIFPAVLIVLAGPAIIGLVKSALFTD